MRPASPCARSRSWPYESGVANTVDPLGGSYFVERLTLDMEQGAFDYFDKLDAMGGMVRAIERGFPQKEIADASYAYQRAVENGEKIIVGVNEYVVEEEPPEILRIGESVRDWQTGKLAAAARPALQPGRRAKPGRAPPGASIAEPRASRGSLSAANTMPYLLDCVRAYATLGEICDAMRGVLGTYQEVSIS